MLSTTFEQALEHHVAQVKTLVTELGDAEEGHKYIVRVHGMGVDKLLQLQQKRLLALHKEFMEELIATKHSFEDERREAVVQHGTLRGEMMHTLIAVREESDKRLYTMEADFTQTREYNRRKGLEAIHNLQTEMDTAIESLERSFEDAHAKYLATTEQRVQDFKALAARGQYETHMKDRQRRAIARLQATLGTKQAKLMFLEREEQEKVGGLTEERAAIAEHLSNLKARMALAQVAAATKLKGVALRSAETKSLLGERVALAQSVIKLAEDVRQVEQFSVKVNPVQVSLSSSSTVHPSGRHTLLGSRGVGGAQLASNSLIDGMHAATLAQVEEELSADVMMDRSLLEEIAGEPDTMANFYDRYNRALLEKLAVQRRHEALSRENEELKTALQDCMSASSLSPATLQVANPLLIINGRGAPPRGKSLRSLATVEMCAGPTQGVQVYASKLKS